MHSLNNNFKNFSRFIIAIDGPSATGKTTLSKALSDELNFPLLLTGKIYRAYAISLLSNNVDINNFNEILKCISEFKLKDLEQDLSSEQVAKYASIISSIPMVRKLADKFQLDFIEANPFSILEGRDIGTVICPDANLKIFLTASPEVRAKRRMNELNASGNYNEILEQIVARDKRDTERSISPLIAAKNAVIIDNSDISQKDQLEIVIGLLPKI